jgi:hypothetical protein
MVFFANGPYRRREARRGHPGQVVTLIVTPFVIAGNFAMPNLWLFFFHPISARFRRKRFAQILRAEPKPLSKRILDAGGIVHFWQKSGPISIATTSRSWAYRPNYSRGTGKFQLASCGNIIEPNMTGEIIYQRGQRRIYQ